MNVFDIKIHHVDFNCSLVFRFRAGVETQHPIVIYVFVKSI